MAGQAADDERERQMAPDLVAPMAAFLAHEACPVSGEIYAAGAGRFARIFIASTPGYVHAGPEPTIEDVAENWATINDETGYYVPADLTALVRGLHGPPAVEVRSGSAALASGPCPRDSAAAHRRARLAFGTLNTRELARGSAR